MKISIEVLGTVQLERAFISTRKSLDDLRFLWPSVEREFHQIEREQFASEGAAGGVKWKELSPAYAKQKLKRYPGKTILRASDRMFKALTGSGGDAVVVKEPHEFGIGTSLDYPLYHMTGTNKMPARPPVNFSESQKTRLTKVMQAGIITEIRRGASGALEVKG